MLRISSLDVQLVPRLDEPDRARLGRCLEVFESFCTVTESVRQGIAVNVLVVPAPTRRCTCREKGGAGRALDSSPVS